MFFDVLSTKKIVKKNLEGILNLKMTIHFLPIAQWIQLHLWWCTMTSSVPLIENKGGNWGARFSWVPLLLTLGCLIFVSPLASHVGVFNFRKSYYLSRWSAGFSWVPLPLTLGCLIFVSLLAFHVGVLDFMVMSRVWYSSKHGATHRKTSQVGHIYIVRPTNRVGESMLQAWLSVRSSFNKDLTTSNRNEGNDIGF